MTDTVTIPADEYAARDGQIRGIPVSASIAIQPGDPRCRYWAKLVRADTPLPLPSDAHGANDVPGPYSHRGDDEIFPGDVLIEGEENHHRRARGWSYWVAWCDAAGRVCRIQNPGIEHRSAMKSAGLPAELLPGSGGVAAVVRVAHAIRLGLPVGPYNVLGE